MGETVFAEELFRERTGSSFKMTFMWMGEESIKKSVFTEFTSRYHS